jgi:membrane protease YdiL (CAAX protease family)
MFPSARDLWWGLVIVLLLIGGLSPERSSGAPGSLVRQPWSYRDMVLIFLLWAGASRIDLVPTIAQLPVLARTAAVFLFSAGAVLITLRFLLWVRHRVSFSDFGLGGPHCYYYMAWSFMIVGVCLSVSASGATFFVLIARSGVSLVGLPGPPERTSPLYEYLHQSPADLTLSFVIVAYAAVLGPLLEEIMFRGLFIGPFARRFGVPLAVTVSAALWSLGHSWMPLKMAVTFGFGLAFARIYVRTGSLVPSLILHISGNAFAVILPVLLGLTRWQTLLLPLTLLGMMLFILSRGLVRRLVPREAAVRLAWSGASAVQEGST